MSTALNKLWKGIREDTISLINKNITAFQKIAARELEVTVNRDGLYVSGLYYCEFPIHLEIEDYAWMLIKISYYFELYKRQTKNGNTDDFKISYFAGEEEEVLIHLQYQEAGLFFSKFFTATFDFIENKENLDYLTKIFPQAL